MYLLHESRKSLVSGFAGKGIIVSRDMPWGESIAVKIRNIVDNWPSKKATPMGQRVLFTLIPAESRSLVYLILNSFPRDIFRLYDSGTRK